MASSSEDPRVVRKEFGLLYAGLFNKIRFPGRFQVDETGNRVVDSPYNTDRIDFTGDVADLYFEPDTFYVNEENDLMIRKRKRDDEGQVTDVQRLKVGKLDLEATEAMRQEFATLGEVQNRVNNIVGGELDSLKDLLNKYTQNSDDLGGFVDLLNQQIQDRTVALDDLKQNVRDIINSKINREQAREEIVSLAYPREQVDQKIAELQEGEVRRTGDLLQNTRALEETLYQIEKASGDDLSDVRRILSDEYVRLSVFENAMQDVVRGSGLDERLTEYVRADQYQQDLSNSLVTRTYLNDYAYAKEALDQRFNQITTDLSGTNQSLTDRYINSIKTYVSFENFPNRLAVEIPNYNLVAFQPDLTNLEDLLKNRIQQVRAIAERSSSDTTVLRGTLNTLEDSMLQWRKDISDLLNSRISSIDGDTAALQNLFQSVVDANASSISSLSTRVTNNSEALGFGDDPSARLFAYISDLDTALASINSVRDTLLPSLETKVDDNTSTITSNQSQFNTFRTRVIEDFLDLTDQAKVDDFKNQLEVDLAGFTKDEMRGFLNTFYNRNFGPARYYPVRKGWVRATLTKPNTNAGLGLNKRTAFYDLQAADGNTYERINLAAPASTGVAGDDFNRDPQQMLDLIETSYDKVDFFRIFFSKGDVYVLYPKSSVLGNGSSLDGRDMRFVYALQDTTTDNLVTTDNYTPYSVHLWRQTVREYSDTDATIARIDRIVPIRPWASTKKPTRFRFDMDIDCMPDGVGFTGLGTV